MRYKKTLSQLRVLVFACLFALVSTGAWASALNRSYTADGITIYVGLVPAARMWAHPKIYGGNEVALKVPKGPNMYHVLVALYDRESGRRIKNAKVEMRISPLGLVGPLKPLHPMAIGGDVTYCNYFKMTPDNIYRVRISIHRGTPTRTAEAEFTQRVYPQ